ncbi:hypothetical protein BH09PSE3_BH09PSE3_05180 [soil metagenome]
MSNLWPPSIQRSVSATYRPLWRFSPADIEWFGMAGWPYRTDSRGPAAVAEHILGPMMTDWQDLRVSPLDYYDAGDAIISTGRYSGAYRRNSTSMVVAFAHIWTVGGGRLRRFRQFSDTLALYRAMQ